MSMESGKQEVKAATISAQVRRADGTVEDLGVVAHHHSDPLRRALLAAREKLGLPIHEEHVYGENVEFPSPDEGATDTK